MTTGMAISLMSCASCASRSAPGVRGVFTAGAELWPDPWFKATLADAYFGFLTVYLWIAYKEPGLGRRILWLVLLLALGNIAIAAYIMRQTFKVQPGDPVEMLRNGPGSKKKDRAEDGWKEFRRS